MGLSLIEVEYDGITCLAVGLALATLLYFLGRTRPGLKVGLPVAVGFALRVILIPSISLTGLGKSLRGGDEKIFLGMAHKLDVLPFTSSLWWPWNHTSYLHVIFFAFQLKLGSNEGALRVTQIGIALAGVLLILAAVYDLGGSKRARLAAWFLNLEIASLFFNELIHKDPLMELASGFMVFGATKVWRRIGFAGIAYMVLGTLIALATRSYVGYFLGACTILLALHAWIRQVAGSLGTLPGLLAVAAVLAVGVPVILAATSSQNLKGLQHSQDVNTSNTNGDGGNGNGNNLALESVNFSSRTGLITNLPSRVADLMLRPWPWQVADTNQMVGVAGSLIALTCWFSLIRLGWRHRRELFDRVGPLLYPFAFLMIAYALAVGNAGTGFRYRTHLVTLGLAMVPLLLGSARQRPAETAGLQIDTSQFAFDPDLVRSGAPPLSQPIGV